MEQTIESNPDELVRGTLLIRAAKRFRNELETQLKGTSINACQYFIMNTLAIDGGMTQGALSSLTGVDRTALVSFLDELEANGYVTRNEMPDDRRANRIELTSDGRNILDRSRVSFREFQNRFLSRLDATEIETLNQLLRRLV